MEQMYKPKLLSKIYVVNGASGAGKDTFCEMVTNYHDKAYTYTISTVDTVKKIAEMLGWNGEKTPKDRKFLSDLKDVLTEWREIPIRDCIDAIDSWEFELKQQWLNPEYVGVVFIMAREPSDIYVLTHLLGAKSLIVRRTEAELAPTSNHADKEVLNCDYDIEINNNGTLKELMYEVIKFCNSEGIFCVNEGIFSINEGTF